jgi:hypothetical protein
MGRQLQYRKSEDLPGELVSTFERDKETALCEWFVQPFSYFNKHNAHSRFIYSGSTSASAVQDSSVWLRAADIQSHRFDFLMFQCRAIYRHINAQ